MLKKSVLFTTIVITMAVIWQPVKAQTPASNSVNKTQSEIQQLRSDVDKLKTENETLRSQILQENQKLSSDVSGIKSDLTDKASIPMISFFIGIFCALWAQNTQRNPWPWFFLGFFFTIITGFFLLAKNADDLKTNRRL